MKRLSQVKDFKRLSIDGEIGDDNHGCFSKGNLFVIASNDLGWDHVSVSLRNRCPTWEEMEQVKREFFLPDEMAMQFHVPTNKHINIHKYCLHLWRPHEQDIPLPPKFMV
ncbi:MAG: hypothetical protein AB7U85_04780 [Alphaproteobacteria bacterium]